MDETLPVLAEITVPRRRTAVVVPVPWEVHGLRRTLDVRVPAAVPDGARLPLGPPAEGHVVLVHVRGGLTTGRVLATAGVAAILGLVAYGLTPDRSTPVAAPVVITTPRPVYTVAPTTTYEAAPVPTATGTAPTWVPELPTTTYGLPELHSELSVDRLKYVSVGSCVANDGTDSSPDMRSDPLCAPGSYTVLRRNPYLGESDCAALPENTDAYKVDVYNVHYQYGIEVSRTLSPADSYVLCLSRN
ncbi:hypothetical protein [Actinosynnema sp. NPDC020468]|uniref:hypothetical protein n=1 Tax=Actinosynnema sp. NPDC020468 TaxID=3154488 RepID=UPI0033CDAD9A